MANPYLLIRQGTQDFGNVLQQGAAGQRALLNLKAQDAVMEQDRQNKLEYLRQQSQYAADLDLIKRQRDMQMQQAALPGLRKAVQFNLARMASADKKIEALLKQDTALEDAVERRTAELMGTKLKGPVAKMIIQDGRIDQEALMSQPTRKQEEYSKLMAEAREQAMFELQSVATGDQAALLSRAMSIYGDEYIGAQRAINDIIEKNPVLVGQMPDILGEFREVSIQATGEDPMAPRPSGGNKVSTSSFVDEALGGSTNENPTESNQKKSGNVGNALMNFMKFATGTEPVTPRKWGDDKRVAPKTGLTMPIPMPLPTNAPSVSPMNYINSLPTYDSAPPPDAATATRPSGPVSTNAFQLLSPASQR